MAARKGGRGPERPGAQPRPKRPKKGAKKARAALAALLAELGPSQTGKRLGVSQATLAGWSRRGVPARRAADVADALERRRRGQKAQTERIRAIAREKRQARRDLFAQRKSEVTRRLEITSIKMDTDGIVHGWTKDKALMRLFFVLDLVENESRWLWAPDASLGGYRDGKHLMEKYDLDPEKVSITIDFKDLMTPKERKKGKIILAEKSEP
jgi:hypothetical protein